MTRDDDQQAIAPASQHRGNGTGGPPLPVGERRHHQRFSATLAVLDYQGSPGVSHGDMITDISQGGVRLITTAAEQPGTRVRLRLRIAGPRGEAELGVVEVRGQVVWARQAPPYQAGIKFLALDEQQRRLLAQVARPTPA